MAVHGRHAQILPSVAGPNSRRSTLVLPGRIHEGGAGPRENEWASETPGFQDARRAVSCVARIWLLRVYYTGKESTQEQGDPCWWL